MLCFWIPLFGTSLGAALVFLLARPLSPVLSRTFDGLAAGVMTAAAFFSLLLPAAEASASLGVPAFLPPTIGFLGGALLMMPGDFLFPAESNGSRGRSQLILAVTLHNVPEGMAVGVMVAGLLSGTEGITAAGTLGLAIGIGIQNVPEGAVISLPLRAAGKSRRFAFLLGVLSGAVEPAGAFLVLLFAPLLVPAMPYLLSFAAGAMLFVVTRELCPSFAAGENRAGDLAFAAGFALMMALDLAT